MLLLALALRHCAPPRLPPSMLPLACSLKKTLESQTRPHGRVRGTYQSIYPHTVHSNLLQSTLNSCFLPQSFFSRVRHGRRSSHGHHGRASGEGRHSERLKREVMRFLAIFGERFWREVLIQRESRESGLRV